MSNELLTYVPPSVVLGLPSIEVASARREPVRTAPAGFRGPLEVCDPDLVAETYRFRARVWQGEGFAVSPEEDDHARHARHWIVTQGDSLVGAARLTMHDTADETPCADDIRHLQLKFNQPFAFLSHLAVCPSARKVGLGALLDTVRVEAARTAGVMVILGRFYEYRVKGLTALGFRPIAEFTNPKIGNRRVFVMELRLAS